MVFYAVSFIVIVDIEKEFDDLDHIFFILDLEKFRFWANDIAWVKTWLKYQKKIVISKENMSHMNPFWYSFLYCQLKFYLY